MISREKIDKFVDLRIEYLKEVHNGISSKEEELLRESTKDYVSEYWNKECFPFLIEVNGEAVSCAILHLVKRIPTLSNPTGIYAVINGVYTKPEYRNRGYATALVEACVALAAGKDASFVELFTYPESRSIYERYGFEEWEVGYPQMRFEL